MGFAGGDLALQTRHQELFMGPGFGAGPLGQSGDGFGATGGDATGASVAGVVGGSAAEKAGITAGSTITAVGGTAISSSTDLTTALSERDPGDRVSVTWTDASGNTHTAPVTLGSGPAD